MSVGKYISGGAHIGLIGWLVAGWGLSAEPLPFEFTEVTMVSADDFADMISGNQPDIADDQPDAPEAPSVDETPPAPEIETPPETSDAPVTAPPPERETLPDTPPPLTPPPSDISEAPPPLPDVAPVTEAPNTAIGTSLRPKPRPAPRIAPTPVSQPEPDAQVDDIVQQAPDAAAETDQITEADETTAPEESAPEIVTEAETPAAAPTISLRPQSRPNRPASQTTGETETATATQTTSDPVADAVAAAVAEASATDEPAQSQGAALSDGDAANFLRTVGNCWNAGSVSSQVLETVIVVRFSMFEDGRPDTSSFEMISFSGGGQSEADVAYRMTRSAVTRCAGAEGYNLPPDSYDIWRDIELTIDPRRMRTR